MINYNNNIKLIEKKYNKIYKNQQLIKQHLNKKL